MALITLEKQPYEKRLFAFNFTNKMQPEALIDSIVSIVAVLQGAGVSSLTIESQSNAGQKVQALFGGGVSGEKYKITCKALDDGGQSLELDGYLKIKEL